MNDFTIFVKNIFMIKAIIIESEDRIRQLIANTIKSYCPNVDIIDQAIDIKSGISAINEHEPDLVLLDIKQKDGSGFEVMDHFSPPEFKVIFFSSYPDYAIKAIKYNAIDYITKPIKEEELAKAVNKADNIIRYEEKLYANSLGHSISNLKSAHRLVLKSSNQVHLVEIKDIIHIKADGNYSTFYLNDGRKIVISKSTKEFEEPLFDEGFHRIHKSHIVNINEMSYFDKADGGTLVMSNGDQVPVASRKRDLLMGLFESLT